MRHSKILDVLEDQDRVYFSFFLNDNNDAKIIGVPKRYASNQGIYVGTDLNSLRLADEAKARFMLNELMRMAMSSHPSTRLCNPKSVKLLTE